MTALVTLPNLADLIEKHHRRIRRLEASTPQATAGACDCEGVEVNLDSIASGLIDWDEVVDPHDFWSPGTPSRLTVPTGLAGVYNVSLHWRIEVE